MVVVEAVAPVVFADEFTDFVETGNVKYVSLYGSFFRVKCHHSSGKGLNPCLTITSLRSILFAYCSLVIPV